MPSKIIWCIIIVISLVSCNDKARYIRDIEQLTGNKIEFPEGYVELSCSSSLRLENLLNQDVKIVSYIDNVACTACCAKYLKAWQTEINNLDENVAYIVVVRSTEKKEFLNFADSLSLDYPLMFYDSDIFGKQNGLKDILARDRTFLLNKDDEVILVGEPFGRERLSRLYKKCIDSLRVQK